MKRIKFSCLLRIMMFNVALFLVGCAISSPPHTPTEEVVSSVNTLVATHVLPTQTSLPATQTPSATPSLTPMPSLTPTPSSTPTPTVTRRLSAIPTPLGIDPIEQVLWLYETNNGCQLPCWWGITPGQTTWEVAERFFNSFVPNIDASSGSEMVNYSPRIPLSPEVFGASYTSPVYTVRDGIVTAIRTSVFIGDTDTPLGYLNPYILPTFLATYGQPAEVWLFTYPSPFEQDDLPFIVILFYPDQSIVALYGDNGDRVGDFVRGCPQENPVSLLKLWSPDLDLTFEQVKDSSSALEREYLSLEESTGMDIETFYQTFQNPDNTTCLETPADLWR